MKKATKETEEGAAAAVPSAKASAVPVTPWQELLGIHESKLVFSPTNPRKHFPEEAQRELEDSMREHGFTISTLSVRPLADACFLRPGADENHLELVRKTKDGETVEGHFPRKEAEQRLHESEGRYEIVTGERRLRAARAVGIGQIPCMICQLTDRQVREIQLIENLKRKDLTPMEEADALRGMLDERDDAGKPVYTAASLGKKVGATARTIERKVLLCRLDADVRRHVESGFLPFWTAVLIAGIVDPVKRAAAAKDIIEPKHQAGPRSYRDAVELVKEKYVSDLRNAPFDVADEKLVPVELDKNGERVAGGSCRDCPQRSGNMESLGEDEQLKSAQCNLCMNPACFAQKRTETFERWRREQNNPEKNIVALGEEECRRIYMHGDQLHFASGYVDLAQHPDGETLKPGVETAPKWRELLGDSEVQVCAVQDRNGKTHHLVKRELALAAVPKPAQKLFKPSALTAPPETKETPEEAKARNLALQKEAHDARRVRDAVLKGLQVKAEGAKKLPEGFWQLLAESGAVDWYNVAARVCDRRGLDEQAFAEELPSFRDTEIIGALVEYSAAVGIWDAGKTTDMLPAWCKLYGVEAKEIEKAEKAAIKQEDAARAAEEEIKAGLAWGSMRDTPESFNWDAGGCLNPDMCELAMPKKSKVSAAVFVAYHEKGYTAGCLHDAPGASVNEPALPIGPHFTNRGLALESGLLKLISALKAGKSFAGADAERLEAYLAFVREELAKLPKPEKAAKAPAKAKGSKGAKKGKGAGK